MAEIVTIITTAMTSFLTAVVSAIVPAFDTLIYVGTGETKSISTIASIGLTFVGITMAYGLFNLIKRVAKVRG